MDQEVPKAAVVGGGVAGITAAYLLSQKFAVTVFERNEYLGGHTNTRVIEDGPDAGTPVDTGFIVCNPTNYPRFYRFLDRLGVPRRDSDMSFGYYAEESGLCYVGPALKEFVQAPHNFLSIKFLGMLVEQRSFNRRALRDIGTSKLRGESLGEYVRGHGYSQYFCDNYLMPLAASIWSSPEEDIYSFPAETFITFFRNHGMLELHKRPNWQTVVGGSHKYIEAFRKVFAGQILTASPVRSVERASNGAKVRLADGSTLDFDTLVLATHADEALALLADPSETEREVLGKWRYHRSRITLHTDESLLPQPRRLWASWNYIRKQGRDRAFGVPITYYMNRLQGLRTKVDYFVTLNADQSIASDKIIYETEYTHPAYTSEAVEGRSALLADRSKPNTYFCGSYLGYGFHEDAVSSAVDVAEQLGCSL